MLFLYKSYKTLLEGVQRIKLNPLSICADIVSSCVSFVLIARPLRAIAFLFLPGDSSLQFPSRLHRRFRRYSSLQSHGRLFLPPANSPLSCGDQRVTALKTVSSRRRPALNILILHCVGINYAKSLPTLSIPLLKVFT